MAILTNVVSSIGNFALSLAVARTGSLAELGQLGVAMAVYVLATGMIRSAVADTILSNDHSRSLNQRALRRVLTLGLMAAALTLGAGVVLSQPFLLLLGCALPGIVVYDFIKIVNLGTGASLRALSQESVWTTVSVVSAFLGLTHRIAPTGVFAGWVFSCAVIGLTHAFLLRYYLVPGWGADRDETKVGLTFAFDFLAGSGTAQIITMAVAAVAGTEVAGALRGAGTILVPLTVVAGTLPSLLIPHLTRARREGPGAAGRAAKRLAAIATVATAPIIALVLLIPNRIGQDILGDNWAPARTVLPMIAAELFFAILAAIPFAGHRVERAGVRVLRIRLTRAPIQLAVVVAAAAMFGLTGTAWAMAAAALIGTAGWWTSYQRLLRLPRVFEPEAPTTQYGLAPGGAAVSPRLEPLLVNPTDVPRGEHL